MPDLIPDKASMFDRAILVLASLEIATSLDFFHKLGFKTHDSKSISRLKFCMIGSYTSPAGEP